MKLFNKAKKVMALTLASSMLLAGCATDTGTEENKTTNKEESNATTEKDKEKDTSKEDDKETSADKERSSIIPEDFVKPEKTVVIEWAGPTGNDPYLENDDGEYVMAEEHREGYINILEEIKEELNVDLQFVPITETVRTSMLKTVLAGDPLGHLVNIEMNAQGVLLVQNVIQPLDEWEHLLSDTPAPKMFGKHVFLEDSSEDVVYGSLSPLVYNIDYIEAVPGLKVDGETVYPTDLYLEGKWTWNTFIDYLEEIDKHYMNSQAPERPERRIEAFTTDWTETIVEAMHSNGAAIYGGELGLQIDTPATREAVAYVQELVDLGLLTTNREEGKTYAPWASQATNFIQGETVFTEMETWRVVGAAGAFAERDESIGFIPFPRPDHMEPDDPRYQPSVTAGGSTVIPRGIPEDEVPLAILSYRLFNEKVAEYNDSQPKAEDTSISLFGVDVFHEEVGADMYEIYQDFRSPINEYSIVLNNIYWNFMSIVGPSLFGIDGASEFDIEIEKKKHDITNVIAEGEALLNTTDIKDNVKPEFKLVTEGEIFTIPMGTDPTSLDWTQKFTAEDNIDGPLDIATATFDTAGTDFNTPGEYGEGLLATIKDSSDNEKESKYKIIIYDAENKEQPVITVKEDYRNVRVDEDTSKINWADFIEAADVDGLNINSSIVPDLSQLDATTAGEYDVKLTATDYVGNTAEVTLKITVAAE